MSRERVCIVGSGNWGSTAARIVAQNVLAHDNVFEPTVDMWVYEETIVDDKSGEAHEEINLTAYINREHVNPKYLPGVFLGENVVAVPDLKDAVAQATMLVFVLPHQFIPRVCAQLANFSAEHPNRHVKAISLVKGMEIHSDGFHLISQVIVNSLSGYVDSCSVLMGANIASEIAIEHFSEATIGYSVMEHGKLWQLAFDRSYFECRLVEDVAGPELCGTLKNIVALGAGFVDGLELGNNAKAAIMRIGLMEMRKLAKLHYGDAIKDETFFESCGIADLITTCYGGRNRKCAEAYVKAEGKASWGEIESKLLQGQKLQGVLTCNEVYQVLQQSNLVAEFPLFVCIFKICNGDIPPSEICNYKSASAT